MRAVTLYLKTLTPVTLRSLLVIPEGYHGQAHFGARHDVDHSHARACQDQSQIVAGREAVIGRRSSPAWKPAW